MHFTTLLARVLLLLSLCACDGALRAATAPGVRALGILAWEDRQPRVVSPGELSGTPPYPGVVAPDTVSAGVSFVVVVTTIGPTNCWREAGAAVELHPRLASVTPYDHTPEDAETACGDVVVALSRRVDLVFRERGEAVLRVHGRRVVGRAQVQQGEPIVVEKRIHVR